MKATLLLFLLLFSITIKSQIYKNPEAPVEKRVDDLVSRMTLEEKILFINGVDWMYTHPLERLDVPTFKMTDGPTGTNTHGKSTAYPASVLNAATWDTALNYKLGVALGRDCRSRDVNFLLAPGVNIARAPMNGRNFEYMGEDPFLASQLAVSYINGVQSQGVVATVKHFVANNQEYDRDNVSSDIDERTMHEIYLPAFKAAVQKANVGAVMNSYNLVNGVQASHNSYINNIILKEQWGFTGILMSDWNSVHDGLAAFKGGTDLEMPGNTYMTAKNLMPAFESGEITEAMINDKVSRILRVCFEYAFFDRPQLIDSIPHNDPSSAQVALELARSGIVLLKNENNILPVNSNTVKKIAVIGPNGDTYNTGGGSSRTTPFYAVSCFEGLKNLATGIEVNYTMGIPSLNNLSDKAVFYSEPGSSVRGLMAEYFNNRELAGKPQAVRIDKTIDNEWVQTPDIPGIGQDNFSARWTGVIRPEKTTAYKFTVRGDDGYRLWIDNEKIIDLWSEHGPIVSNKIIELEAGKEYKVKLEYFESGGDASITFAWYEPKDENFDEAVELATNSDLAIVCIGFNHQIEHEGAERPFEIPEIHDSLISYVTRVNPNTIVILNAGGNVYMENWLPKVKGLIHAFYPGQEGGAALAEIILGKVNPSGKLPVSFEKKWEDNPTYNNYYDQDNDKRVQYNEGLLLGYRYYDTKNVEPMFPFGFGLSYTTFKYSKLKVKINQSSNNFMVKVTFNITNTGDIDGAEIAQLYVSDLNSPVLRPAKELKGFLKTFLKAGETKEVTINLDETAFSYYKTDMKQFDYDPGEFEILIGASSQDVRLRKIFSIE
jgi:beta-glucosidase